MSSTETGPNLVFVSLDTGTVEDSAGDGFVIDTETAELSPAELDVLDAADQFGSFGDDAAAIVRRVGVSVADLWAAYKWRDTLRRAGLLKSVEKFIVHEYHEIATGEKLSAHALGTCPKCGSADVGGEAWQCEGDGNGGGEAWQSVRCGDCGYEWHDVYDYRGPEPIKGEPA